MIHLALSIAAFLFLACCALAVLSLVVGAIGWSLREDDDAAFERAAAERAAEHAKVMADLRAGLDAFVAKRAAKAWRANAIRRWLDRRP